MKISALWITKNEADNIARSIDSVRALADELVVVDTGSSDATVEVARESGARVEHFEWVDDFSAARNWALKQASGDVVIFLDADEWFEPALKKSDRKTLERMFSGAKTLVGDIQRTNLDPAMNITLSVDHAARIVRGKGAAQYVGSIHEFPQESAGQAYVKGTVPGWNINHSGYAQEVSEEKRERNRALLQSAVASMEDNTMKALYHYYLMRECNWLGREGEACASLQWLLDHPALLQQFMHDFAGAAINFIFTGLYTAARLRSRISRVQLYEGIVANAKKLCAHHPISHTVELLYKLYFDYEDHVLLAKLDAAFDAAEALRGDRVSDMADYFSGNVELFTAAGEAAWRYGDRERAFDYATKAIRQMQASPNYATVALLLRCVKGLPTADIILFLNSALKTESHGTLEMLISALQYEGFAELYAYYVKRLLDAGMAKKSDFWYMLIVMGKADEAAEAAFQALESTEAEVVHRTIFLAIACTQNRELYARHKAHVGRYAPVLERMLDYTGNEPDINIAVNNYQLIAFAGGRDAAKRFVSAYTTAPDTLFLVQARYYLAAGLYAEFLKDNAHSPAAHNREAQLALCECTLKAGNSQGALWQLQTIALQAELNDNYFNLCAAVAAITDSDSVRQEALSWYDAYHPLYEKWLDWGDVARCNRVFASDTEAGRRTLAQMTLAELDQQAPSTKLQPFHRQLGMAYKAAEVFVAEKSYEAAFECYKQLMCFGVNMDEVYTAMAQMFEALGNETLAADLRIRATSLVQ